MSKSLHPGMCNFPLNMPIEERAVWGRLAFEHDRSIGAEIKRLALLGLKTESPQTAARIAEIRRQRKAAALLAVACVGTWLSLVDADHSEMVRAFRAPRVRRNETEAVA